MQKICIRLADRIKLAGRIGLDYQQFRFDSQSDSRPIPVGIGKEVREFVRCISGLEKFVRLEDLIRLLN